MYIRRCDLAGIAILHWLLPIFLPIWNVTRRIAAGALFPVYAAAGALWSWRRAEAPPVAAGVRVAPG